LDPELAEVLFDWQRKSQFGEDSDWVSASRQTAGAQIGTEIGWHTFRHTDSCMLRQSE